MQSRAFIVGRRHANHTLLDILQGALRLPRAEALHLIRAGQVRLAGQPCADPRRRVRLGQRVEVRVGPAKPERPRHAPAPQSVIPAGAKGVRIVYADAQLLVIDKPAGLTTVRHADEAAAFGTRAKKYLPPTLVDVLPAVLAARGLSAKGRIRAVHRLDRETSGLLVFARTPDAERSLGLQFRAHTIGRVYLALVRGTARDGRIESYLVRDRGDGRRGSGSPDEGQHAVTHVRVVENLGADTLVECRLETGRTHQVRIHLGEAGTPLCGERIYDRPPHGAPLPDASGAERPMLHALTLELDHPVTGARMTWTAPPPRDMHALLRQLRKTPPTRRAPDRREQRH